MELTDRKKIRQLQSLTKATMTDRGNLTVNKGTMTDEEGPCHYESSISVSDSATQVDCSPQRPEVKTTGVSPIKPHLTQPATTTLEASTQTSTFAALQRLEGPRTRTSTEAHSRSHRRTLSEGDSLFYKKKARIAFKRVRRLSRQIQNMAQSQQDRDSSGANALKEREESAPEIVSDSGVNLDPKKNSQQLPVLPAHKYIFQQQVNMLQRKLRTLNKQVYMYILNSTTCYVHMYLH